MVLKGREVKNLQKISPSQNVQYSWGLLSTISHKNSIYRYNHLFYSLYMQKFLPPPSSNRFRLNWRINGLNMFDTSLSNDFISFLPFSHIKKHKKSSKMYALICQTRSYFYQLTCDMCLWIDDCIFYFAKKNQKIKKFHAHCVTEDDRNHWNCVNVVTLFFIV